MFHTKIQMEMPFQMQMPPSDSDILPRPKLLQDNHDYMHFPTKNACNEYIINNRIMVAHICCGGKGFARIKIQKNETIIKKVLPNKTQGTCDICFTDDIDLYYTCTRCKQPYCMSCLQQITSGSCPYCRGKLTVL
jgi:hypothetical protein